MLGEVRMVEMFLLLSMMKFCAVHSDSACYSASYGRCSTTQMQGIMNACVKRVRHLVQMCLPPSVNTFAASCTITGTVANEQTLSSGL